MRHNKTRRGGSKTGKKNKTPLLSKGETYSNGALNTVLTPFQRMNLNLKRALKNEKTGRRLTRSMKNAASAKPNNNTPDLLIFPSSRSHTPPRPPRPSLDKPVSEPPPPRRRSKTRSKSKSKGNNAAAVAATAGDYVEKQDRLLCGKHAFNNVVGQEIMKMEDIFRVLRIPEENQASYGGDIDNYDLQNIINEMQNTHGQHRPLYSAFPINSINSVDDGSKQRKNTPLNVEKRQSTKIWSEPAFERASEDMKTYINNLYESFLMLLKYTPNFSGLIFQISNPRYNTGHYIAIRKLPTGQLQMIDSIGPTVSDPIPFMTDDLDQYRENCAALIQMLFKKAGMKLNFTDKKIRTIVLNILVVKLRFPVNRVFY